MRNSRLLLATAAAAATVLTIVVVHEGSVDASNERGTAEITAGSRAVMSDASGPRLQPEPPPQVAQAPEPPAPTKRYASPEQLRRHAVAREQIQQALTQRAAARPEPEAPPAEEPEEEPSALPNGLRTRIEGNLDKEYIREAVRKDLIPLAHDCYSSILATDPKFTGTLVLEFDIMGDEDVGGIVDGVVAGEGTDVANPEFIECMSESMMTVMFPPPVGGGVVHVSYPLLFEPE